MDILIIFLPLLILGGFLFFFLRKATPNQKAAIESIDKSTESNNRLTEAVNRLADVIAKK